MASKIEWLGGRYALPHKVRDGDSTVALDIILWLELPRDVLVGSMPIDPRDPVSFGKSLEAAMREPAEGSPRRPSRIRVADQRSAHELREAAAGIPIVVAPTPELDAAFEELTETVDAGAPEPSYLGEGEIPPQLVEELFKAASVLFRTAPWRRMSDQQILRVDIPRFGIEGACLSIIGAAGESFGLVLFSSIDDYDAFGALQGRADADGHLSLRSLSFDRKKDLPPSLMREIKEHRWPVEGPNAYPVVLCITADLSATVVTEDDVRILTDVTRAFLAFFVLHRDLFDVDDPPRICESSEGDDGVEITLTAPFVHGDAREDAGQDTREYTREYAREDAPPMRHVGRNDPCPCGSGKKYKKCHLDADEAPRREAAASDSMRQMDFRLVEQMARFASSRIGPDWLGIEPEREEEDALELILPWATWTSDVVDVYLQEQGRRLSAEEREWIAAQKNAWVSVWEVTAVERGRIDARDLLTGETRSVRDELVSRTVAASDTLLARVIDYRGLSYFGGMHRRPLTPSEAAAVIDDVRAELRLRTAPVPAARLRDRKIGRFLIDAWNAAVERISPPPVLQNIDGDPLQLITDSFRFDPASRREIEKRIEAIEYFANAEPHEDERVHRFVRDSDDTVLGQITVGADMLRIETNSERRADVFAARLAEACAGLLRDRQRTLAGPRPFRPRDEAAEEPSPEHQAVIRKVKEDHYRKWLDLPLPALDGETPRDAARFAKSRRALNLVLRDIEHYESQLPEASRFDVGWLRRELDLKP